MYKSTRGNKLVTSSEAIIKGLAEDGGLFIPYPLPKITFDSSWLFKNYQEVATEIFKVFFDDFTAEEIKNVIISSYNNTNFKNRIVGLRNFDNISFLELYHGPTLAFKDMALTALPHLMNTAAKKLNLKKKITILTATSGDTGSAALCGFSKAANIDIAVLYPNNGVSSFQEKQMLHFTNDTSKAFAIEGNFDDCQRIVKEIFNDYRNNNNVLLSSANSINIGRLVPQIVYYFYGYLSLVNTKQINFGDLINVSVPTGNFGNILAAFYAKLLGLPIDELLCASNENDVLTDFINQGIYDANRQFHKTNSPSMDILISSNVERLLALLTSNTIETKLLMESLKEKYIFKLNADCIRKMASFKGYSVNQTETLSLIKSCYDKYNYLIDPHTAVAYGAYQKHQSNNHTLIISTAAPYKFADTIKEAFAADWVNPYREITKLIGYPMLTEGIKNLIYSIIPKTIMNKDEVIQYLFGQKIVIKVPATTANLGPGFDIIGMALKISNKFAFKINGSFELVGFDEKYSSLESNLVLKSYRYVFEKLNQKVIPISVELLEQKVPTSRGMGSSATCIVAGVMAAGYYLKIDDKNFLLDCMIELEGHPDNVAAAYLGGMVASFAGKDKNQSISYPVSNKIKIIVAYPPFELATKNAREVLPNSLSYDDVIFNASRLIHFPRAFYEGNVNLLRELVDDRIHQPYRLPLIDEAQLLFNFADNLGYACCISGSGPALLFMGSDDNAVFKLMELKTKHKWTFVSTEVDTLGARLEEEK